jgi:hypothetical protein
MKAIKAAVSTSFLALPTNLSLVVVLALLLGLPAVGRAGPVSYTFTSIAETGGLISGLSFTPTISGDGTVAFLALVSPGPIGIFAGTGGPLTTIAAPSPFGGGGFGVPPFSNVAGTVVFYATAPSGVPFGIFTGNGGPLTPLYNSSAFRALGTAPTLNSAGTAAFVADPGAGAPSGVFTGNGGPVTAIADSLTFSTSASARSSTMQGPSCSWRRRSRGAPPACSPEPAARSRLSRSPARVSAPSISILP